MKYRFLGRTGVRVSELCFGCMTFGNFFNVGGVEQNLATAMVDKCLDAGINFFDTADVYASGVSEEMLGKALGPRRPQVIVATKTGARLFGQEPNNAGATRLHILDSVEASLRRLGTDYIDLYQIHIWDNITPLEETLRTLDDLVRAGKVRYIGCSNYLAWHITKSLWLSDIHNWVRFETMQMQYSLLRRDIEWEHIPLCQDQSLSVLPWSPLAGGFLSGKFRRGATPKPEWRRTAPGSNQSDVNRIDEEQGFKVVDELDAIARAHRATVAQVALAWLLAKPAVDSVIIGARSLDQLVDNLGAADVQLTEEEVKRLDAVSAPPSLYPYSMIAVMSAMR